MTQKKPPGKLRRPRREYSIGDFLSWMHGDGGLRRAVKRVQYEDQQEKLFKEMKSEGEKVN